jgi:hypothetical protein
MDHEKLFKEVTKLKLQTIVDDDISAAIRGFKMKLDSTKDLKRGGFSIVFNAVDGFNNPLAVKAISVGGLIEHLLCRLACK